MGDFLNKLCLVGSAGVVLFMMGGGFQPGKTGTPSDDNEEILVGAGGGGGETNTSPTPSPSPGASATPNPDATPGDPTTSDARAQLAIENGVLYDSSNSLCARGANNMLSWYVNGHGEATAGANANAMAPQLQSKYGMSEVADTGSYQNGDTRILQNSGYGHIETYMAGNWYSDFKQEGSLMGSGNYSSAKLYRLP